MKNISKTVWILSLVSLLTDMASEMLYPVLPIYLKKIGYSFIFIGILEGLAEAIAGLSKAYFGRLSDHSGNRVSFVQIGYGMSALSKPMMAFLILPFWVFVLRTIDRLGKGIRTGARDAILSQESTSVTKATVFGFHRSMDTLGAVIGPLFALYYLLLNPGDYASLFYFAFIPGILAILVTLLLNKDTNHGMESQAVSSFSWYWKSSPSNYKKLLFGVLLFALFNSSDVFLLLKVKESGFSDVFVIGIYIFYNIVFSALAYPIGILADKIGIKVIFVFGILLFSFVYFGMSLFQSKNAFVFLFFIYGIYAASTEGVVKAWVSNLVEKKVIASAIGTLSGLQSICSLLASTFTGLIWYHYGGSAALLLSSIASFIVAIYFFYQLQSDKVML